MTTFKKIILNTDGGSRGNPGIAGAGIVISDQAGTILKKRAEPLGVMTNNEAEYEAVIRGLETVKRLLGKEKAKHHDIEIRIDSELVAKQLNGEYQIKEERLFPLFIKVWNIRVRDLPKLTIKHIPREQNSVADLLANEAMDLTTPNQRL